MVAADAATLATSISGSTALTTPIELAVLGILVGLMVYGIVRRFVK